MKLVLVLAVLQGSAALFAGQKVEYQVGKQRFEGYFAKANNSKGTVVVIHDWDGLTEYEVKRAEMLAKLGYNSFAVDLYGKGNRPKEIGKRKAETKKLYNNRKKMRQLILAGIKETQKRFPGNFVVMGYCFGGAAVLELARSKQAPKELKGYASFHGGLKTPEGQKYTKAAPIFIAHGGADKGIPMTDVAELSEELEEAKIEYDIEVYSGAPHAFTVFGSSRYQKRADEKSWSSFLRFASARLE